MNRYLIGFPAARRAWALVCVVTIVAVVGACSANGEGTERGSADPLRSPDAVSSGVVESAEPSPPPPRAERIRANQRQALHAGAGIPLEATDPDGLARAVTLYLLSDGYQLPHRDSATPPVIAGAHVVVPYADHDFGVVYVEGPCPYAPLVAIAATADGGVSLELSQTPLFPGDACEAMGQGYVVAIDLVDASSALSFSATYEPVVTPPGDGS